MSKLRYLLARLADMDYRNMFRIAKAVAKKAHKPRLFIVLDMVRCGLTYQAGYYDYQEFEFYLLNAKQRRTYLTRGINNAIIRKYNDKSYFEQFNDKIVFNRIFDKYLGREWCDLRSVTQEEFAAFAHRNPVMMAKPIDGEGGTGIEKYVCEGNASELYWQMKEKGQDLVEGYVEQHEQMNRLYPNSVNTLRMFTIYKEGKGIFLQAMLKMGNGGTVDNFSAGGMYTFVDATGRVVAPAIDKADCLHIHHPVTGTEIAGFSVPDFDRAVDLVCRAACEIPQVAYVGWDVAIGKDGPVLIEGNCFPGVFQLRASLSPDKQGVLPLYRQYMEI